MLMAGNRPAWKAQVLDLLPTPMNLIGLPTSDRSEGRLHGYHCELGEDHAVIPTFSSTPGDSDCIFRHRIGDEEVRRA